VVWRGFAPPDHNKFPPHSVTEKQSQHKDRLMALLHINLCVVVPKLISVMNKSCTAQKLHGAAFACKSRLFACFLTGRYFFEKKLDKRDCLWYNIFC
jgi:hypothetical protein